MNEAMAAFTSSSKGGMAGGEGGGKGGKRMKRELGGLKRKEAQKLKNNKEKEKENQRGGGLTKSKSIADDLKTTPYRKRKVKSVYVEVQTSYPSHPHTQNPHITHTHTCTN